METRAALHMPEHGEDQGLKQRRAENAPDFADSEITQCFSEEPVEGDVHDEGWRACDEPDPDREEE